MTSSHSHRHLGRHSGRPRSDRRGALGRWGERRVALYLRLRGYRILERDLRTPLAQVDILARRGDLLCVCEVKSGRGSMDAVIRREQRQRLARAAVAIQARRGRGRLAVRIDLLTVQFPRRLPVWLLWLAWPRIRHYRDAITVEELGEGGW